MRLPTLLLLSVLRYLREVRGGASGFDYATPEEKLSENYDFIIVGGGPAGCRLLEKLTNVTDTKQIYKVLLIEAGGNPPIWSDASNSVLMNRTPDYQKVLWNYSRPNYGLYERDYLVSARVLGGGTTINADLYQRGCAEDYDRVELETGCKGWDYKEALRIFMHDENQKDTTLLSSGVHGTEGTLCVSSIKNERDSSSNEAWQEALAANNFKHEPTGQSCHGTSHYVQGTACQNTRQSAVTAFVTPFFIPRKEFMHIKLNTIVTKLILDRSGEVPRVIGVETADTHTKETGKNFFAKEVIVTAGSLRTPQILMLSGIGPSEHLKSLDIEPVVDLPGVGTNLHHHPYVIPFYVADAPSTWTSVLWSPGVYEDYVMRAEGPIASLTGAQGGVAYARLNRTETEKTANDYVAKYNFAHMEYLLTGVGPDHPYTTEEYLLPYTFLMHPISRGYVQLNTSSPTQDPFVNLNYFDDENDLDVLVEGAMHLLGMLNTSSYLDHGVRFVAPTKVGCDEHVFGTKEFFRCVMLKRTGTIFHYTGTTKMSCLEEKDPLAVVNARCQVYGVENLRVADLSIIDQIPQGHPLVAAYVTGYRCGEFILEDHASE